tara:strand:+ start:13647 stop:14456 length:810 start_codon:yes stop_codon:yes gene_type:complete
MNSNKLKKIIDSSASRCKKFRKRILDISQTVTALHAAGAFSSMEIVDILYNSIMKKGDTFVMSKGHGCIAQYVVLEYKKILSKKQVDSYCKPNGILGCHPDYGNPGIEASTGSLGHGMGIAAGMAHANVIKKINKKIYVVISDGELQEGSTWENMMMAANLNLKNLICILDHNGSQSFGHTIETHPKFYPIIDKVKSFGFDCASVNGHSVGKIINKIEKRNKKKPFLLICNTVKGKGVSFMENKPIWHYRSPTKEEHKIAIKELKEIYS